MAGLCGNLARNGASKVPDCTSFRKALLLHMFRAASLSAICKTVKPGGMVTDTALLTTSPSANMETSSGIPVP